MSRTIYALRVRHTPEGIRLPERDYRHDVWSLIQAAAVRVTYRAPLDGWEPYTAVYEVEDTQGWTTLYAVQAAPNLCHREPSSTRRPLGTEPLHGKGDPDGSQGRSRFRVPCRYAPVTVRVRVLALW